MYVTLERDGRQKKFLLGSDGAPRMREVLNEGDEAALDAAAFIGRCTEKVSDLADRTGGTWDTKWSQP